jgi:hypothetical protein
MVEGTYAIPDLRYQADLVGRNVHHYDGKYVELYNWLPVLTVVASDEGVSISAMQGVVDVFLRLFERDVHVAVHRL